MSISDNSLNNKINNYKTNHRDKPIDSSMNKTPHSNTDHDIDNVNDPSIMNDNSDKEHLFILDTVQSAKCHQINILGFTIYFPYPPYDIQKT